MDSKGSILKRLRDAAVPFADLPAIPERTRITPLADYSPSALRERFIAEALKVSVNIWPCADDLAAIERILALIGTDRSIMAWDFASIPVAGLGAALAARGIVSGGLRDTGIRVGLTGAAAALATTGSLVVPSGAGKPRAASLLPPVHIAVLREAQIVADLEAWFEAQRADGLEAFRASANTVLITGVSRTADIAQELIQGAHGPIEVHAVLIP